MIKAPGIHFNVPEDEYHRDVCPEPSLSASLAKILINRSPLHAWMAHPRLNKNWEPQDPDARLDFGSVAHKLLLGRGRDYVVIAADDWRTKAAREQREEAHAAGKIAVLPKHLNQAGAMVAAARDQLKLIDDCFDAFTMGDAEAVLTWQDGLIDGTDPIWMRGMIDWLPPRRENGYWVCYDFKSTDIEISPSNAGAFLSNQEYEIQAASYERGLETLTGDAAGLVVLRFVIQEKTPPYLLQVVELSPAALMIGRKKLSYAIHLFRRCLDSGDWPGFPATIIRADFPPWSENRWLAREMAEDGDPANDPFLVGSRWVPPEPVKPLVLE